MPVPPQEPSGHTTFEIVRDVLTAGFGVAAAYFANQVRRIKGRPTADPNDEHDASIPITSAREFIDIRRELTNTQRQSEDKFRRELQAHIETMELMISQLTNGQEKFRSDLREEVIDIRDEVRQANEEASAERRRARIDFDRIKAFMKRIDPEAIVGGIGGGD